MMPRVRTNESTVATWLSWKAADISSLESTGAPVTPAWTLGNTARRRVTASRMASMARASPVKLDLSPLGVSTSTNRRLLSSDRK